MNIVEFLEARIAEDEAWARKCEDSGAWSAKRNEDALEWFVDSANFGMLVPTGYVGNNDARPNAEHIARHDPERVLAECAAKRAIIQLHREANREGYDNAGAYLWDALYALASVYRLHPDYRQDWTHGDD